MSTLQLQSQSLLTKIRQGSLDFCQDELSLLITLLESGITDFQRHANTDWIVNITGWSKQKVRRLARQNKIPGATQAIPGRQHSEFKFNRTQFLAWWEGLKQNN